MWPDAPVVRAFLASAQRRILLLAAAEGAALGLALALALGAVAIVTLDGAAGLVVAGVAALACVTGGALAATARLPDTAALVERRAPQSRNIVLTAAELMAAPVGVQPHVGARVCADAARMVRSLDPRTLFPARRATLALGASALVWLGGIAAVLLLPRAAPAVPFASATGARGPAIERVIVAVEPPPYMGRPTERATDPSRIEVLAGSSLGLEVRARAELVIVETVAGRDTLRPAGDAFTGAVTADADGYVAIEARSTDGRIARRLIGLTATPDHPPAVRITAPARDLVVPDGARTVDVAVEATDDLALAALALTFTRVSGSGEQHDFSDGTAPLSVTRASGAAWSGRGVLRLDTMRLEPGDMVVYRAVARDRRPRASAVESDAFIIEVAAPGDIPAEGFSSDDEERYALSQQMILVKTERLIARAPSLPPDSLAAEAALIAAEQRAVRAEFVFMMGGELAEEVLAEASMEDLNEEAHAEMDDEAIAGRLRNRGRLDLLRAIRAMSRANAALLDVDLARARTEERAAIDLLQQAFSRTRYILRALTQRERLDLSRRLTGDLSGVGRGVRPAPEASVPARVAALRRTLADVAALDGADGEAAADGAARAALAVLRIDPSADALRDIAAHLDGAAAAFAANRSEEARARIDRAVTRLAETVRQGLGRAAAPAPTLEAARLQGAVADALRRERP